MSELDYRKWENLKYFIFVTTGEEAEYFWEYQMFPDIPVQVHEI